MISRFTRRLFLSERLILRSYTTSTNVSFPSVSEFSSDDKNTQSESALSEPIKADLPNNASGGGQDWSKSFHGLSAQTFSKEITDILLSPINPMDIECKPGKYIKFIKKSL